MCPKRDELRQDIFDVLEERASEVIEAVLEGESVKVSPENLSDLTTAGLDWLIGRNRGLLESAVEGAMSSDHLGADMAFLDLAREYLDSQLERYVRRLLHGSGDRMESEQTEWLKRGSLANIASYLEMVDGVHEARSEILGTPEALSAEAAARWLVENDARPPREHADSREASESRLPPTALEEGIPYVGEGAVRSDATSDAHSVLLARNGYQGTLDVLVVGDGEPRSPGSGSAESTFGHAHVIAFRGALTEKLKAYSDRLSDEAGGWLEAVWLILTGVWAGRSLEIHKRRGRGQPSFSVAQEALVMTALEMQIVEGLPPFTEDFFLLLLKRWNRAKEQICEVAGNHPRIGRVLGNYRTTEQMRKALVRFRCHLREITSGATRDSYDAREYEREREALEGMRSKLVELGWLA